MIEVKVRTITDTQNWQGWESLPVFEQVSDNQDFISYGQMVKDHFWRVAGETVLEVRFNSCGSLQGCYLSTPHPPTQAPCKTLGVREKEVYFDGR